MVCVLVVGVLVVIQAETQRALRGHREAPVVERLAAQRQAEVTAMQAKLLAAEQAASRSLRAGALADCRSAFRLGRASITEGCAFVTRSSDRCEQQIWTRGEVREEGADGPQVLRCALRDGRTTQVRLAERLLKHRLHDFAVSVLTHQPSCRSAHTAAVYLDRLVALSQRRRLRLCSGVEG